MGLIREEDVIRYYKEHAGMKPEYTRVLMALGVFPRGGMIWADPLPLDEAAKYLGIEKAKIHPLRNAALKKLRRFSRNSIYEFYYPNKDTTSDSDEDRLRVFDLPIRASAANALKWAGYIYVDELKSVGRSEILKLPNFGVISLKELEDALRPMNIELLEDIPQPNASQKIDDAFWGKMKSLIIEVINEKQQGEIE